MGKDYKIPRSKNYSKVDPVDRGYVLFFGFFSVFICFFLSENSITGAAHLALVVLITPLLIFFMIGALFDHYPRIAAVLSSIVAGIALAVTSFSIFYMFVYGPIERQRGYCVNKSPLYREEVCWRTVFEEGFAEQGFLIVIELMPLLLCLLVFGYALFKAIKLGRTSGKDQIT